MVIPLAVLRVGESRDLTFQRASVASDLLKYRASQR